MKFVMVVFALFAFACGDVTDAPVEDGAFTEHEEASDFELAPAVPGKADDVLPTFDEDNVVSDAFFNDANAMTVVEIQAFLDNTPYGNRSWLATESVNGRSVAQIVAGAAQEYSLNPMMILSRFQVEGSHISKSRHPGSRSANRSLGCGCFDGQQCRSAYFGIDKQVDCAADTLRKRYQGSVDRSWAWQRGVSKRALDGVRVTPDNHATASLYAYTPWVLRGRGGNWLVWNILKKFIGHAPDVGSIGSSSPSDPSMPLWVGAPCSSDNDCGFQDGENFGFCYDFVDRGDGATKGFCSLVCEGFCPDRNGTPTTFCVAADIDGVGICASKSERLNNYCTRIPGTVAESADRFVGSSSAPAGTATVCVPND